jgi:ubiquitin C
MFFVRTNKVDKQTIVKHMIAEIENSTTISPEQQRLIYSGKQLQDNRTLSDYNLYSDCTIQVLPRLRGGAYQIYLKLLSGERVSIEVEPTDTIFSLKQQISNLYQIPVEQQTLMVSGTRLIDAKSISDYKIMENHTVFMVIVCQGG